MTDKHAAMPWKRDKYGTVVDANGETVVLAGFALNTGHRSEVAEANTDFAFRACVAHDDLVKALEAAVARLGFANNFIGCEDEIDQAQAALAKAKGETK